ncbi:MAG: hypothetical protein EA376_05370 [Phycisphaeraceae bacterium]|nr:MAG: hypothetical protein EA376_05370 [Phycisphaeraceae bacterium]
MERLNELAASRQPEGEDAWPIYARILQEDLSVDFDVNTRTGNQLYDEVRRLNMAGRHLYFSEWMDPSLAAERERFESVRHLLQRLDEAADAPEFSIRYTSPADGESQHRVLLPGLSHLSSLHLLNIIGLQIAAAEDDWDEVARRFRTAQSMSRHLTFIPALLTWNHSVAMHWTTHDELMSILMALDVPADACEQMLEALDDLPRPATPLWMMYEGERLLTANAIQWIYTPGKRGFMVYSGLLRLGLNRSIDSLNTGFFNRATTPYLERAANLHPRMFDTPRRGDTQRAVDDVYDAVVAHLKGDGSTFDSLQTFTTDRVQGDPIAERSARVAIFYMPSIMSAHTMQRSMAVMLRLELFHARAGRWPDSLDEAMTPEQATDPVSGLAFRYERTPDDPHGRPYVLRAPEPYPYDAVVPDWPVLNPALGPDPAEPDPLDL